MIRRPITWALALGVVGAVAFLVASFVDFRRLLVIGALLLILPVAAYLVRGAVRSRWSRRSLALLVGAGVLVAAVGSVSGYRLAFFETCLERVGVEADLVGCDLSQADLGAEHLRGANLTEANVAGADLRHADLRSANLTGANLREAELGSAVLHAATLRSAVLDGATVGRAQFTGAVLDRAELRGVDLRTADLARVSLAGAILDDAKLSRANLAGRNLRGASAQGAILFATRLDGADLSSADLSGARLQGARLAGANLKGADLADADLSKAVLDRAKLAGVRLGEARLKGASLVGATGLSDSALATILGVSRAKLARALIEQRIRLEARGPMLRLLGRACRGRRVPGAARYPTGSFHPLVILGGGGWLSSETNHALRRGWEPTATRFAQLVACTHELDNELEVCPYTLEGGAGFGSIARVSYSRRTRIIAAASGRTLFEQSLEGSTPPACPARYGFSTFSTFVTFSGTHIGFPRVRGTLVRYVGR